MKLSLLVTLCLVTIVVAKDVGGVERALFGEDGGGETGGLEKRGAEREEEDGQEVSSKTIITMALNIFSQTHRLLKEN